MSSVMKVRTDPTDQLPALVAGQWAVDTKHALLKRYVGASAGARSKFTHRTYIDLFSGPGRVCVERSGLFFDGGPLAAWAEAAGRKHGFTQAFFGDASEEFVSALRARCETRGVAAEYFVGPADETVQRICERLPKNALNLAFLDPFSMTPLTFGIIEQLAQSSRHTDLLIHFSAVHLARSIWNFVDSRELALDRFAPGWREAVDLGDSKLGIRHQVLTYWLELIRDLGYKVYEDKIETVRGEKGELKYLLVLASRHPLGNQLWDKIRDIRPQAQLL